MWLYRLTNNVNGKAYIGTSVHPISHRISRHLCAARRRDNNMVIAAAIRKYGIAGFLIENIGQAKDYAELIEMEKSAIAAQNTLIPNGYNITAGGGGSFGRKNSAETRKKMGAGKIGRPAWNSGKKVGPLSEEHREKLSAIHKGRTPWNKGIPATPEHKEKLKGRMAWNKGVKSGPMSEAQKLAIAETMRKVRAERNWSSKKKLSCPET